MSQQKHHAVTGAFGYSGKYIARALLDAGKSVITLTNSMVRESDLANVPAYPLAFDNPDQLAQSLEGVDVLYNTYWVRFNHKLFSHADAVANTKALFDAARKAGVRRVVHVSITNPRRDCGLEYFEGKAELEETLQTSGMGYAILRPAVIFGREDILINNIAWFLRNLPVFGVPGDGSYRLQPIHVEDLAELALAAGTQTENSITNAIGPDTFTFRGLAEQLADVLQVRCRVVGVPTSLALWATRAAGLLLRDTVLTKEEVKGLMGDYLYVDAAPVGQRSLLRWAQANADTLGKTYASELRRRRDREVAYIEQQA